MRGRGVVGFAVLAPWCKAEGYGEREATACHDAGLVSTTESSRCVELVHTGRRLDRGTAGSRNVPRRNRRVTKRECLEVV